MVPNTFEGVTLRGKVLDVGYAGGCLWGIKPRNRDHFLSMSEQAGASGSDEALWWGALTVAPARSLEIYVADYYLPNAYNTGFLRAKYTPKLRPCLDGRFGLQGTDQRSVGDDRLGEFATWNVGAGAALQWASGLSMGAAAHWTADDASIRSPYGTWPGWLSMIEIDFDRAGEFAWGVQAAWDFGAGRALRVSGLTARAAYVQGTGRVDPGTGAGLPTTRELDLDLIYGVPTVKGLQLRLRNAYVDSDGDVLGYQFRFIVNWEIDLL
jgi:hypothetical protein